MMCGGQLQFRNLLQQTAALLALVYLDLEVAVRAPNAIPGIIPHNHHLQWCAGQEVGSLLQGQGSAGGTVAVASIIAATTAVLESMD